MAFSVEMPELGESVTEGTITRWLKEVGDTVAADEPLLEVSTDKVDTEVPSPAAGVLIKIHAEEDDTVDVGDVIAEIGEEGESADEDSAADSDSNDSQTEDSDDQNDEPEESGDDSAKQSGGSSEATDVAMPELGESVSEGTITRWLKEVGDTVEADEPLLEVSTDKVDTEVPSPVAGTLLEILADEDDTVDVGDVIARIGDENAASKGGAAKSDDSQSEAKEEKAESKPEPKEEKKEEKKSSGNSAEATDVSMPELGESVTEGTITRWLKEEGDTVEADEPLLEVSTDKVDTEVPSPVAGTLLKILAGEDETVEVGDVIARIGDESAADSSSDDDSDAKAEESKPEPKEEKKEAPKAEKKAEPKPETKSEAKAEPKEDKKADTEPGKKPYVTPLVRKIADKHGVDLSTVKGTGVGGRIRKQDVMAVVNGTADSSSESTDSKASEGKAASSDGKSNWSTKRVDPEKAKLRGTTQKVNRIRQLTASKTLESLHVSAQLTQVHEVDMTAVATLRKASKPAFKEKYGVNLTYLPFFAKAIVEALVSHPNVNASYNAETKEMTYHDKVNLGFAVDTPAGLLSPVVHDAQDMTLPELAQAIVDLADRARNNKLKPNDLTGGTFTITNIGSEGALSDTPILVPPQAAMIGTGAIVKRPVVISEDGSDAIAIRQMVLLPMTYDHQIVDGADAGRFMTTVRDRLETADFESDLNL